MECERFVSHNSENNQAIIESEERKLTNDDRMRWTGRVPTSSAPAATTRPFGQLSDGLNNDRRSMNPHAVKL